MADESYTIAVTDEGTIDQLVALLQLLGLEGEAASARLSSGFTNMSTSQKVAEASTRAFAAAAEAGFTQTQLLASAMDKLTTAEQQAVTNLKTLPELVNTLALAADKGVVGAAALTGGLQSLITASGGVKGALTGQGEAVEGLTRLQINLAERAAAADAAFLTQIATANSYTTSLNNTAAAVGNAAKGYVDASAALAQFEREQLAANISIQGLAGTYTGLDNLLEAYNTELAAATARTEAFAAANASLTAATEGLNISEKETVALLQAFGVTAAEAAARVTAGFAEANTQIGISSGQFAILSEAEKSGYKNTQELAAAFGLLSQAELDALSHTSQLDVAITAITASAQKAQSVFAAEAAAIADDTKAFSDAINASTALAAAEERLADINAADAAAFKETAASIYSYVGSIEAGIDALAGLSGAELKAAESALALQKAELAAADAAVTMEARLVEVKAIGGELAQTFGGLNAIFAGAFAVGALEKASDEFTKIQVTLGTVTKSTAELNSVYDQLHTIANQTQTSLEANAKSYVQLADATKGTSVNSKDLIQAVGGLDSALKIANVTGQDAYRVQRTLQEALSTSSGSADRFFQNLQRESPAAFALFNKAAQDAGINMAEFGSQQDKASNKLYSLNKTLDEQNAKFGTHQKSAQADANAMSEASKAYNTASEASNKYSAIIDAGGKLTATQRAEYDKLTTTMATQSLAYGNAAAAYTNAKGKQDDATSAAIAHTKAQIANTEATLDTTKRTQDFITILKQLYVENGPLAQSFTTVSGALTVLKNNLVDFAGNNATASASMTVLKDVILLAANNLNIIIPLVIAFAAGVAIVKVANLVTDIIALTRALGGAAIAFVAANIEVIVILGSITLLIAALQAAYNAFAPANKQLDIFGSIATIAGKAADGFGAIVQGISAKITDNAIHTQASSDATKALAAANGDAGKAVANFGNTVESTVQNIQHFNGAADAATKGLAANSTVTSDASKAYIEAQKSIADASAALVGHAQAADNAERATAANNEQLAIAKRDADDAATSQNKLNDAVKAAPSLWDSFTSAISSAISKLGDFISTAAQAAAAAAKSLFSGNTATPAVSAAGHARDGGTFTVAGSGPVDSKLIAVSPGEVVTVQTPAQYHAGVRPAHDPAQTHFATGGVSTGAGVDLGASVSLSDGTPGATPTGITGYSQTLSSAIGTLTVAQNANVATTTANTSATTANTSADATNSTSTTTNTGAVTANTSALATLTSTVGTSASNAAQNTSATGSNTTVVGQNTSALGTNGTALATATTATQANTTAANENAKAGTAAAAEVSKAAADEVKAANDNTRELNIVATALKDNSQNVIAASNAVVTADNSLAQTMASAANAIVSAANTMATAAQSAASASSATASTTATTSTASTAGADETASSDTVTKANATQYHSQAALAADLQSGTAAANGDITGASGVVYKAVHSVGAYGIQGPVSYYLSAGGAKVNAAITSASTNTASDVISDQYAASQKATAAALNQSAANITASQADYKAISGTPYSYNTGSGLIASTESLDADKAVAAQLTSEASNFKARDGAEFYVPGGTGVDSRMLNIAVSPGEAVQVRTPAQQNTDQPSSDNSRPIIFQVTTQDAQSFVSSQAQIEGKLVRGLRRAQRR